VVRANPGKYNFSSSGKGGAPHMAGELFKSAAGLDMTHVPYNGAGPALNDVAAGLVQLTFTTYTSAQALLKTDKVSAVAVAGKRRLVSLPQVPTFEESGVKGLEMGTMNGLLAPAKTPQPVIDKIYAAAGKVLAGIDVPGIRMEAFKYYYIPSGKLGLAGIVARPSAELRELQRALIDAVAPFTVAIGGSDAFATTPDDPVIDPLLIGYVSTFVRKSAGEQFSPHVTTGIAPRDDLDHMLAEPFDPFTFSPAGAAVYQLGQFGTAAKKLHDFALRRMDART